MKPFVITVVVISFIQSVSSQIANPFSGEGCGHTRSCFRDPVKCDGTDGDNPCSMFVSWWPETDAEVTNFALFGEAEGYIAVGISRDTGMSDTDVYACTSRLTVKRSYNPPDRRVTPNEPKELIGVSNISVTVTNGYIECEFKRQQMLPNGDDTFFDISGDNTYYSLMAIGSNLEDNGEIEYHDGGRQGSDEAVSFSRVGDVDVETTTFKLFKAHGAMMAVAWIGFAAPGITVARYMKPSWENKLVCGVKVWFVIHRINMSMTFILTCAAFVIIFVAKKTFLSPSSGTTRFVHALFGTTIMGLALINVIMAIFRPHPGTPKRKYYNWAHRSVGLLALGLSGIEAKNGQKIDAYRLWCSDHHVTEQCEVAFLVSDRGYLIDLEV